MGEGITLNKEKLDEKEKFKLAFALNEKCSARIRVPFPCSLSFQASVIHSSSDSRLPMNINIFKLHSSRLGPTTHSSRRARHGRWWCEKKRKREEKDEGNKSCGQLLFMPVYEKVCDISSTFESTMLCRAVRATCTRHTELPTPWGAICE